MEIEKSTPLQFSMDLFETCVLVVNIMKMCMWVFGGARVDFD